MQQQPFQAKHSNFEQISTSLPLISCFLSQAERLNLASTNKFFRQFIMATHCWGTFQIYNRAHASSQKWANFMKWASKYLRIINPENIIVSIFDSEQCENFILELLIGGVIESVQKLDIYFESDDVHLAASLCFPNLIQLTIRSQCASDQLVGCMFQNMKSVVALTVIKNDMNFTCKGLSDYSHKPFQKLLLKPYLLDFQQIKQITYKSASTLKQLEIDVEECDNEMIVQIIAPLKNLQKLIIYHLENLHTDDELVEIVKSTDNILELTATKAYNFKMTRVIQSLKSASLMNLDLTDSRYLYDEDLICLSNNSPNLKSLNISWCNNLTAYSLQIAVSKLLKLECLNLTGVKQAKDLIFVDYLYLLDEYSDDRYTDLKIQIRNKKQKLADKQQAQILDLFDVQVPIFGRKLDFDRSKIKTFRNLKTLDCRSCNGVSDKILNLIYLVNRKVKSYNYYGNLMTLFNDQNQDEF